MAEGIAASESALTAIDRSHLSPIGSWTIDPADSSVSLTWSRFRLATITGRLPCLGVIHLDDLPSVGVIQFEQPSGLPVLTIALDPASIQTHDADLDARLRSPDVLDLLQHRWWTLRSESLEILPTGAWRVMATVTANGNPALLELRLEVDSAASSADWLVLQGRGLLDRRAFRMGGPGSTFSPQVRLDLAVRARRVGGSTSAFRGTGKPMHNQHAGLSQLLAEQRRSGQRELAAHGLGRGMGQPIRRRRSRSPRWDWWPMAAGS